MLQLDIDSREFFNDDTQEFVTLPGYHLDLEHSLASVFEWEGIWKKPFLEENRVFSPDELKSYIRCMTIGNRNHEYSLIGGADLKKIQNYIDASNTATFFANRKNDPKPIKKEVITAELIYYWMVEYAIPFECQYWHLSRLFALIRICGIKQSSSNTMSDKEILKQNAAINAARRASHKH